MFGFLEREEKPDPFEPVIAGFLNEMKEMGFSTEDSPVMADVIKTLAEARAMQPRPSGVSADTIAIIAANLAGLIIILGFERANVITSKAFGMILRPRI